MMSMKDGSLVSTYRGAARGLRRVWVQWR